MFWSRLLEAANTLSRSISVHDLNSPKEVACLNWCYFQEKPKFFLDTLGRSIDWDFYELSKRAILPTSIHQAS